MLVTTADTVEGKRITHTYGLVKGSSVRTRNVGRDILAALRNIVGGEVPEYAKLLGEAREQAIQRMTREAETLGGNAVVATRIATSMVMSGAAEILVYGTAVKIE